MLINMGTIQLSQPTQILKNLFISLSIGRAGIHIYMWLGLEH